jgi:hypothetical protein
VLAKKKQDRHDHWNSSRKKTGWAGSALTRWQDEDKIKFSYLEKIKRKGAKAQRRKRKEKKESFFEFDAVEFEKSFGTDQLC